IIIDSFSLLSISYLDFPFPIHFIYPKIEKLHNIKIIYIILFLYPSSVDNAFSLLLDDGSEVEESIYNYINYKDKKLFQKGAKVEIIYAYDELKRRNHNGEKAYLDIVLEMAVSLEPVE
ncbi:hypothetical protein SASC598P14_003840, partial [Snodgrassella alvi SCGC AB-598-P14]